MDQILTKGQAAERLQVSIRTLEYMIARQEIKVLRVGLRGVRITMSELNRFVADNQGPGGTRQ